MNDNEENLLIAFINECYEDANKGDISHEVALNRIVGYVRYRTGN